MNQEKYELMQITAQLLLSRDYKPQEFQLFGAVSQWLSAEMKVWEESQGEKTEGSPDSGAED